MPGHPRLSLDGDHKDVDGRDKPGQDETTRRDKQKGPGKTGAFDILNM
jgi:hypothetical protein